MSDLTLYGNINPKLQLTGLLSNATLRGIPVELSIDGTTLRWKYLDEDDSSWRDLIDLNTIDYELLTNLPTLNGNALVGELNDLFMLPSDEVTEQELMNLLNN